MRQAFRRVAVNQRPSRYDVVDVLVAIDVDERRASRALDEEWRSADRLERADRAVDAVRKQLLRAREELPRFICAYKDASTQSESRSRPFYCALDKTFQVPCLIEQSRLSES